jgi:MFS family permease
MSENLAIEHENRWKLLGVLYVGYLALIISFQSLPPVLRFVIVDLELTHAQAGLLMSIFALPGLIISIPGGLFLGKWGVRFTVGVSLALATAGGFMAALVDSYELILIGRLIAGVGGMTLLVVYPQMLAHVFHGKEVGTAMGLLNTAMPVGTIIPFMILGQLAEKTGWHLPLTFGPFLGIAAMMVFFRYTSKHSLPKEIFKAGGQKESHGLKGIGRPTWLVGITWMFFNAVVISFLTFAHKYFVGQGYSDARAGIVASMWFWAAIAVIPLVGHFSDRFGHRETLIGVGCIAMAVLIPVITPFFALITIWMLVLSVVQSFTPAPVYALVHDLVKAPQLGIAYGILNTLMNAGMFLGPWLIGMVWDATGSYQATFVVMSVFCVAAAAAIFTGRRLRLAESKTGG